MRSERVSLMSSGFIEIDDVRFPIESASISVSEADGVTFSFDGAQPTRVDDEHRWSAREPRVYAEEAPVVLQRDGNTWRFHTDMPADPSTGGPFVTLYLFEHEDLVQCDCEIVNTSQGVRVTLEGKATVMGCPVSLRVWAQVAP